MKREYEEAFAEVEEILRKMPIDLSSKIPLEFRRHISESKAQDYIVRIEEPIENQKLKEETVVILGLIYRDFLCTPEEREQLQLKDAEKLKEIEKELQEQYDINKTFEKRKKSRSQKEDGENSKEMIVYEKQGFLKKIFNLVKGIFKKN
ncbi:MAG: hypothetical protein HFJ55_06575 [Clostridia bacterium]|nr:hypothetical protein [Clostridia bacterium]